MSTLPRSVILAGAMSCICVPVLADMIDESGMAPWEVCGLCHSLDGISAMPKFPKLAGQNASYIAQQLNNFKHGVRRNDGGQMAAIAGEVDPADVDAIAAYFASLPAPAAATVEPTGPDQVAELTVGEQLFSYGRTGVQPCAACHSNPAEKTPKLFAQHQAYLAKQLQDFASGSRVAGDSEIVANSDTCIDNARQLDSTEITALSAFLAGSNAPQIHPSADAR